MAIEITNSIVNRSNRPDNGKYMKEVNGTYRPYTDVAEAQAAWVVDYRSPGLTHLIGSSIETAVEYWYYQGTDNGDLVLKVADVGNTSMHVNVLSYGADRTGVSNSTTAINNAIAAATGLKQSVFIPSGVYKVDTINWNPDVMVLGSGRRSTILRSASAVPLFQFLELSTIIQPTNGIQDIGLDGNNIGTIGINIQGTFEFTADRLFIHGFTDTAMKLRSVICSSFNYCKFIQCPKFVDYDEATQTLGYYVPANLVRFNDCAFITCSGYAVDVRNGASVQFHSCDFEVNGTAGNANTGSVKYTGSSLANEGLGLLITSSWFERNEGTIVSISAPRGSNRSVIRDTLIQYPGPDPSQLLSQVTGIKIQGTAGIVQSLVLDCCTIIGSTVDVVTDGANVSTEARSSTVGVHSEANGGLYKLGDSVWTKLTQNTAQFGAPTSHALVTVKALNTDPFVGAVAVVEVISGAEVQARLQANASEAFIATITQHPLSFYVGNSLRMTLPADGGIVFPDESGVGDKIAYFDENGRLYRSNVGATAWVAENPTTIRYLITNGHSSVVAETTNADSVADFEARSGSGVRSRLQSNLEFGFVGTITAHDFQIIVNNLLRILFPAAGGIVFSELISSGDGLVGIHADGSIYRVSSGTNLLVASNANNALTFTGPTDHVLLNVTASTTEKSAGVNLTSGDSVNTRLQSNFNLGFVGTISNHPFAIIVNNAERVSFPAGGGMRLLDRVGTGVRNLSVQPDGSVSEGGVFPVQQVHTAGSTLAVANQADAIWVIVDPASVIASLVITTPSAPIDGQPLEISFGGSVPSGTVVTALTIAANTGQSLMENTPKTTAVAGETVSYRYHAAHTRWYRRM